MGSNATNEQYINQTVPKISGSCSHWKCVSHGDQDVKRQALQQQVRRQTFEQFNDMVIRNKGKCVK